MKKSISYLFFIMLFLSCNNIEKKAKSFEQLLENSTGQSFSVAKLYTEKENYVVFKNESTGAYTAYNLSNYNRRKMKEFSDYQSVASIGTDIITNLEAKEEWVVSGHYDSYTTDVTYYDTNCECYSYYTETHYTDEWIDTSHWYTFYEGGGFRFNNSESISKDLELMASLEESVVQKAISLKLTTTYSLSSDRANELAMMMMKYQKVENQRSLTASEKEMFALDALGVSITKLENSLKEKAQGISENYNKLLMEAAHLNRTTPEQIGKFLSDYSESFQGE